MKTHTIREDIFLAFDLSKKPEDYYCSNFTSDYYVRNSANKDLDLMKVYLSSLPPLLKYLMIWDTYSCDLCPLKLNDTDLKYL